MLLMMNDSRGGRGESTNNHELAAPRHRPRRRYHSTSDFRVVSFLALKRHTAVRGGGILPLVLSS